MPVRFDIDKENRIITGSVSGDVSRDALASMLIQLKIITTNTTDCNLIFDLSDSQLTSSQMDMYRVISIVSSIVALREQIGEKIAHIVPDRRERIIHARDIGTVAALRGIDYQVFTGLEKAYEWLKPLEP